MLEIPKEYFDSIAATNSIDYANFWIPNTLSKIETYAQKHNIQLNEILVGGAASLVISGTNQNGERVVIKAPSAKRVHEEIAVYKSFQGKGVVDMLHCDDIEGVFTMKFIEEVPRKFFAYNVQDLANELHENNDINIPLGDINRRLPRSTWWAWRRYYAATENQTHIEDIHNALRVAHELQKTTNDATVIHGDLCRKNIITTQEHIYAIDPSPAYADADVDLAMFMAWRGHDYPLLEQWEGLKKTNRLAAWTYAYSVIELNPKDERFSERDEFLNLLRPIALKLL